MSRIRIKVFSDFCSSEICKENFERTCKTNTIDNYGPDKEIYITCIDDYTHAIILNKAMPVLTIPKKNVLGLAFEPNEFLCIDSVFIEYAKKNIGAYYIGNANGLPKPFLQHHGYMWFEHPQTNKVIEKKKLMSIVFSEKKFAPGHKYRDSLVNYIINNNLDIDIFGRGCQLLPEKIKRRANVKGPFNKTEPYDDYIFTISIENFSHEEYFSEKVMTPIMSNTIPIYLGCKNIKRHISDYFIPLSGIFKNDAALIIDILKNPNSYIKTKNENIFEKLNLIKQAKNIF